MARFLGLLVLTLVILYPSPAGSSKSCDVHSGDEILVGDLGQGFGIYTQLGCKVRGKLP